MAYSSEPWTILEQLLEEAPEQVPLGGENSADEEDRLSEQSEHSDFFDSENLADADNSSSLDSDMEKCGRSKTVLRGVNGFTWTKQCPKRQSDRINAPAQIIPGPINTEASKIKDFWDLLITNEMLELVVKCTNEKIEEVCAEMMANDQEMQTYHHHTNINEIRAFIGLLYYSGWWKQASVNYHRLWDRSNGITVYKCVMPQTRFTFLSACLRFDIKSTRNQTDKFAPIRKFWDAFIENCKCYYKPHNNCTVDIQLLGFRGRCPFRTYIKSKPDRYGIKIISLNDASSSYMYHAIPYLGKTSTPANESASEYFLREVTAPIHGSGRNITCNSWFTSVPVVRKMLEPPINLQVTGRIHKNKKEIPQIMKVSQKEVPSAQYCFAHDLTLISYTLKKNKIVLLLTSYLHGNTQTVDGKPAIIQHYNANKGGTDCFDMMCHSYTVSRRTLRWPMRVFFGILDQAAVNVRILQKCRNSVRGIDEKIPPDNCLRELYLHLVTPHLIERHSMPSVRKEIKLGIANILGLKDIQRQEEDRPKFDKHKRCLLCPRAADKKTVLQCPVCYRPMCDKHRTYLCIECTQGIEQ